MSLSNSIFPTQPSGNSAWRNQSQQTNKLNTNNAKNSNTDFLSTWLNSMNKNGGSSNSLLNLLSPTQKSNNSLFGLGSNGKQNQANAAGDTFSLSPNASMYSMQMQASLQINYESYTQVATANGYESKKVSWNLAVDINYLRQAAGQVGDEEQFAADPNKWMQDFFSPEKTAERILDFSLSFFTKSSFFREGGNTEEARGKFAEYIGNAIQKGFDQAQGLLGKLPDEVQAGIDKTHDIVWQGLDSFVINGLDPTKNMNYAMAEKFSFNLQSSLTVEETSTTYLYGNDNIKGNQSINQLA